MIAGHDKIENIELYVQQQTLQHKQERRKLHLATISFRGILPRYAEIKTVFSFFLPISNELCDRKSNDEMASQIHCIQTYIFSKILN